MSANVDHYGTTADGRVVQRVELRAGGFRAVLLDYGARLLELWTPDRDGASADIVLGYPDVAAHEEGTAYFGATCGRYGNRIRRGTFQLAGQPVSVSVNEGPNHLHGGEVGFDRHVWDIASVDDSSVVFTLSLPDGDQGFPGAVDLRATFLLGDGTFDITMEATADRLTVMNMVHHSYWNLRGVEAGDVLDHQLTIDSDFYTPVDDELLPTGEILRVAGTPFDFREPTRIGARIREVDHQGAGRSAPAGYAGFDHNWVLRGSPGDARRCMVVFEPGSGRQMELWTNEPAVQFYTGGYLSAEVPGKRGHPQRPFGGFTLETQRFPDSPNIGHFPSCTLAPGEPYVHRMSFRLSTDRAVSAVS